MKQKIVAPIKNSKWQNYYDVVLLPTPRLASKVINLSRRLHKKGSPWKLGHKSYMPHISLYHIKVNKKSLPNFLVQAKTVAKETIAGNLHITRIHWSPSGKFIFMSFFKRPWLKKLQMKVVNNLVPYFDWKVGPDKLWNLNILSSVHKKTTRKYGTPFVGKTWHPHLSLAYFPPNISRPALSNLKIKKTEFVPEYLAVCALGEDYTCQKIIARFPLGATAKK